MKCARLFAALVSFAVTAILASDASARHRMYNPATGAFMQRDPLGTPDGPPMTRNTSGSRFTRRDPTRQYADGMSLYQYVRGQSPNAVDPSGLWTGGNHRSLTNEALDSFPEYATRLDALYRDSFVEEGNVGTDKGYSTSAWLTVGFNAMEATKHYMVGYDEAGRPDIALMRKNAQAAAETRIEFYKGLAAILWRMGKEQKAAGNMQKGDEVCTSGWKKLGTAIHTFQDKFSHTDSDWLPLLSWQHGGTLGLADPGYGPIVTALAPGITVYQVIFRWMGNDTWLNSRYPQALTGTKTELSELLKEADGPKGCNCIEK